MARVRIAFTRPVLCALLIAFVIGLNGVSLRAESRPNFVFILADDLGYGDLRCLNPQGKISTPQLDRLAAGGMIFTDAHSSSAVCTPTRYSILTGRYNWRSRLQRGVLGGLSPSLIEPGRLTVAKFLQDQGYATACIGKWHLGLDWALRSGQEIESDALGTNVNFAKPFLRGPITLGFDYYFGIAGSLDMVPYTFLENDRVVKIPTEEMSLPQKPNVKNRTRRGPGVPDFTADAVLPEFTRRAVDYVAKAAVGARKGKPFFLYLPLNSPHTPIAPTKEWLGKSGLNAYADFVMQTDAIVGEVLAALEQNGVATNTLVIFTSDNGCSPTAHFGELAQHGHNPNYVFRGNKADIFDGGHHVPFLARWPARIKPGSRSDQVICLMDFMATAAEIVGGKLPPTAGEDSVSFLPALLGRDKEPLREALVHHSINGSFAIRQGKWKLELCADSGGWSNPKPGSKPAQGLPDTQLYDLSRDIGETNNLAAAQPEIVARLTKLLERYVAQGRSTPGSTQTNTAAIKLRKNSSNANETE